MANDANLQRAMVVVAHPDDAEWGCSGTVALWCRDGVEVVYVICTDGGKGTDDPDMTSERLAKIRREEQMAACEVLGVKEVVFLDHEDSMLQPTLELRRDIAREIRRFKPDAVITPYPGRSLSIPGYIGHPDHAAAGEATLAAVFPAARDRLTFPELLDEGLEPHKVKELFIMADIGENADKWIDVTRNIVTAIEALKQHRSQVDDEEAEKMMRSWREAMGKPKNVRYAEAYKHFRLDEWET